MKKLSLVAAIALGLLTCVSVANAQGGGGGGGGKKGGARGAGMTIATITNAVTDLTGDQIKKVEGALKTQTDAMTAVMGEDREGWRAPGGFFVPGTESANEAGMDAFLSKPFEDEELLAVIGRLRRKVS